MSRVGVVAVVVVVAIVFGNASMVHASTATSISVATSSTAFTTSTATIATTAAAVTTPMTTTTSTTAATTTTASTTATTTATTTTMGSSNTTSTAAPMTSATTTIPANTTTTATAVVNTTTAAAAPTTAPMTNATTPGVTTMPTTTQQVICNLVYPQSGTILGGTLITITFTGFSTQAPVTSVTVGNNPCQQIQYTTTNDGVTCMTPAGYGQAAAVVVVYNGTTLGCPTLFQYSPPTISGISPQRAPLGQTPSLTITGQFGLTSTPASIYLIPPTGAGSPINLPINIDRGLTSLSTTLPSTLASMLYTVNVTVGGNSATYTSLAVYPVSAPVSVTLSAYDTIAQFGVNEQLDFCTRISDMIQDSPSAVDITGVLQGSIIINFVLLVSDSISSIQNLEAAMANGQFRSYFPSVVSAQVAGSTVNLGTIATPSPGGSNSNNLPSYAIAIIVIFCCVALLVGFLIYLKRRRRQRREIPLQVVDRKDTNMI